jgi:phospholipid N-methyltransferase
MVDYTGNLIDSKPSYEELLTSRVNLMRMLESLTPGGSEFYNDPEACVEYVKRVISGIPGIILPLKEKIKLLEEENKQLKLKD